jgi:hypothetical protein
MKLIISTDSVENSYFSLHTNITSNKQCSQQTPAGKIKNTAFLWGGHVHCADNGLLLFILEKLQFRHGQKQTCWKQCERGVAIELYRARIRPFGIRQCNLLVNNHAINIVRSTCTRFYWLITAVMLIVGKVELNPGSQMKEKFHGGTRRRRNERYE